MIPSLSFIVPTRNSDRTLEACLTSLRQQTFFKVEIVVIDNDSIDRTKAIAQSYADVVLHVGPERSAQRNAGARRSAGEYLCFIDSDMVAPPDLATQIVSEFDGDSAKAALVITEMVRDAAGFWNRCRQLEKIAYVGDDAIEAVRAFRRDAFFELGGFDETLTGTEDWALTDRVRRAGLRVGRVAGPVEHDESDLRLSQAFRKKRYYGRSLALFFRDSNSQVQRRVLRASLLKPLTKLGSDPHHVLGLYTLKLIEGAGAGIGYLEAARSIRRSRNRRARLGAEVNLLDNVLIASHEFVWGPSHALESLLAQKAHRLAVTFLPFPYAPEKEVHERRYANGRCVYSRRRKFPDAFNKMPLVYVRDAALVAGFLLRHSRRATVYVGVDPFTCAFGVVASRLGLMRAPTIFYSIDFVPRRFSNRVFNHVYHGVDNFCARNADVVWNVANAIHEGRTGTSRRQSWAHHLVVPIGINATVKRPQPRPVARLVFLGHLLEKQGLRHAIGALPLIARSAPDIHLDVIGTGPARGELQRQASLLGVHDRVTFTGFVADHETVELYLANGGIGIAPYENEPDSFTRFADPGKLKNYLACALPVLTTAVPPIAKELADSGCAMLVEPSSESVAAAAVELLSDDRLFVEYSRAALEFAQGFTWTEVFTRAWRETLVYLNKEDS